MTNGLEERESKKVQPVNHATEEREYQISIILFKSVCITCFRFAVFC